MTYKKILLKIIEEEIDRFLFEQAAPTPPADSSTLTPPADPSASGSEGDKQDDGEQKDDLEQSIEKLASKTAVDIKKTLLSALQNGADKEKTETLVAYVANKPKKEKQGEEKTKEVPDNIEKAVKHIVKTFKFNVPEKAKKEAEEKVEEDKTESSEKETQPKQAPAASPPATPEPPAAPAAPVKESRLQTSLREYLTYKQLIKRMKR